MKKLLQVIFIAVILAMSSVTSAYAVAGEMHLLLGTLTNGTISGKSMTVQARGKKLSLSGSYNIKMNGGKLRIGSQSISLPVTISAPQPISWNGVRYHGRITFSASSGGCAVGNKIDLELYLCGVLRAEMHHSWHPEALKAQAVVARTYAMKNKGVHGAFDLCDSVHCQVYKGISDSDASLSAAVAATKGLVLRHDGNLASIFYHSDSGGMITRSGAVWTSDLPYLQSRVEPITYTSPNTTWEVAILMSQIQSKLSGGGISVGTIQALTPSKRDESGRVELIEIRGSAGAQTITGHKLRMLLGSTVVKSTLFEFGARSLYDLTIASVPATGTTTATAPSVTVPTSVSLSQMPKEKSMQIDWMAGNRIFTTQEIMEILSRPDLQNKYIELGIARIKGEKPIPVMGSALGRPTPMAQPTGTTTTGSARPNLSMTPATGSSVTFYGRGYGHGVGLSQWGAKAMAEVGWPYNRILAHYFPGTVLAQ